MHTIVVDLGFGDAGKGGIVDWLAGPAGRAGGPPVTAVVRFNGGAQAAHNVVTPGGLHHTFSQFGSATFHGVPTHLSRFMLVDPLALATEAAHLAGIGVPDPLGLLSVDRRALVTTPYHAAANRARERARGASRHGSCGMGIGETVRYALANLGDAPTVGDCLRPARMAALLRRLRDSCQDRFGPDLGMPPVAELVRVYRMFAASVTVVDEGYLPTLLAAGPVLFEGAQGVLLDQWRGFHPYTTWSTTTFDNAETLLAEAGCAGAATRLGVLRAYTTRHGAGPLVTEDPALTDALPEPHNRTGRWQGRFRVGHLDLVAHRYAVEVCGGVDALAVTHLDRAEPRLRVGVAYRAGRSRIDRIIPGRPRDLLGQRQLTDTLLSCRPVLVRPAGNWAEVVTETVTGALGAPVTVTSHGPTRADKQRRPDRGQSRSAACTATTTWTKPTRPSTVQAAAPTVATTPPTGGHSPAPSSVKVVTSTRVGRSDTVTTPI